MNILKTTMAYYTTGHGLCTGFVLPAKTQMINQDKAEIPYEPEDGGEHCET